MPAEMTLVRDPAFWRRFSLAVHRDEEAKASTDNLDPSVYSHAWIKRQQQKKRKTWICGLLIAFVVCFFIAAAAVVIWWFSTHNWLRDPHPQ